MKVFLLACVLLVVAFPCGCNRSHMERWSMRPAPNNGFAYNIFQTPDVRPIDENALPTWLTESQQKNIYDELTKHPRSIEAITQKYHLTKQEVDEIQYEGWYKGWVIPFLKDSGATGRSN